MKDIYARALFIGTIGLLVILSILFALIRAI
jgi:hypothetical protein